MKTRKKNHRSTKFKPTSRNKRISGKAGLPPGTLVHIGDVLTEQVSVLVIRYNQESYTAHSPEKYDIEDTGDEQVNTWIKINGLHETKIIEAYGKSLAINPLILEDVLNTEHRPKLELHEGLLFLMLKAFSLDENNEIQTEQISFVLGKGFLLTFQESNQTRFGPVRTMLEQNQGKLRQKGLDYLFYSLVDLIIDQYYVIAESVGDQLDDLEDQIFENPSQDLIESNRRIKKKLIMLRKTLVPTIESINKLNKEDFTLVTREVMRYFSDVRDHINHLIDMVDTYRELSEELKEDNMSNITLRMNQVMKLLTIITTIFIPLSFISGIYGMNFLNMPELGWKYGYFIVLLIMVTIVSGMLIYFKRKKWL